MPRTGYTLPVFAVAAAKAALIYLLENKNLKLLITIDLLPEIADIPIQQIAALNKVTALAITKSDPGDNLDITRDTPIWAWVKLRERKKQALILEAGEGLGKTIAQEAAIYQYARRLFDANLCPLIPDDRTAVVRIILPFGRQLAQRTSNQAFGILEGLALLGTSGISQPVSTVDRLEEFRLILQDKVKECPDLVFCLGSNGQQVAQRLSIPESSIVMTGNWIGALLVEAGLYKARSILLIGYQGKLIKLAAGIFNTSSHIADAKLETIAAAVVRSSKGIVLPCPYLQIVEAVLNAQTADSAYKILLELGLADRVFTYLAHKISHNAESYIQKYADVSLKVGTILFDRQGKIIGQTEVK
jgi:cobalt-precorrin-5B (C1)-methyltransferase